MADKKLDVIYEEIKREDFFNKIRAALPYIVGGACIILSITAWHSWREHKHEKNLITQEALYEEGILLHKKGEKEKALTIMNNLIKNSTAFRFLALCQKNLLEKDLSSNEKNKTFQKDLETYYSSIVEIVNFFDIGKSFQNFDSPMTPVDKENIWHGPWLLREGILAAQRGEKEKTLQLFANLEKFLSPDSEGKSMWWSIDGTWPKWVDNLSYVSQYVYLGVMALFFEKINHNNGENNNEKNSLISKRKRRKKF